jgi:hypothetical protein
MALELFGEKNRLPNDFSRSSETPNTPTHYSEEPKIDLTLV